MEDTLSLQLDRPGPRYRSLADDTVVGLASLSVTLTSRRRLAINGTVERIGKLLAWTIEATTGEDAAAMASMPLGAREAVRNMVKCV